MSRGGRGCGVLGDGIDQHGALLGDVAPRNMAVMTTCQRQFTCMTPEQSQLVPTTVDVTGVFTSKIKLLNIAFFFILEKWICDASQSIKYRIKYNTS